MPLAGDQPQTCQRDRPRKRTGQKLDTIPGSVDQQTTCARWRRWDFREAQWRTTLRKAGVPYFRIYDLRSTFSTRLSAGGVADEWVTQMLRQTDAQVFKRYSQMKLQMKREALMKLNRKASESASEEA